MLSGFRFRLARGSGGAGAQALAAMQLGEVERRPLGHDALRVAQRALRIVAPLAGLEIDRSRDLWHLSELAGVAPEVRVVDQAAKVALERAVIGDIEAHERREQADVR